MEWEKQQQQQQVEDLSGGGGGGSNFVKVMTDEQMEILRKQIAVYGTICEQLVELHKSLTSHNDHNGVRLGNIYCDPLLTSGVHKITGRQRWTPTPMQLQILERIFDQESGTPSKQKIKEITADLSQHGQISETNVYNWFQNRRARSKRKQQAGGAATNADSEVETEAESCNDKKSKPEDFQQNAHFLNPNHAVEPSSGKPESMLNMDGTEKIGGAFMQMPFYDTMLSNPNAGMELIGKMEVPGNYNPYMQQDDYGMTE